MILHRTRFIQFKGETINQIQGISSIHQCEHSNTFQESNIIEQNVMNEPQVSTTKLELIEEDSLKNKQHLENMVACLKQTRIEFYNVTQLIHTITGHFSMIKLTPLHLFAVNGNTICVYSTVDFKLQSTLQTSSPVWAIDAVNHQLVVATQNIQVYFMHENYHLELQYQISFVDKVLSLKIDTDSLYLSTDTSLVYHIELKRNAKTITRIKMSKKRICWDIILTKQHVILATSTGMVDFYQKSNFTLLQSIKGYFNWIIFNFKLTQLFA